MSKVTTLKTADGFNRTIIGDKLILGEFELDLYNSFSLLEITTILEKVKSIILHPDLYHSKVKFNCEDINREARYIITINEATGDILTIEKVYYYKYISSKCREEYRHPDEILKYNVQMGAKDFYNHIIGFVEENKEAIKKMEYESTYFNYIDELNKDYIRKLQKREEFNNSHIILGKLVLNPKTTDEIRTVMEIYNTLISDNSDSKDAIVIEGKYTDIVINFNTRKLNSIKLNNYNDYVDFPQYSYEVDMDIDKAIEVIINYIAINKTK